MCQLMSISLRISFSCICVGGAGGEEDCERHCFFLLMKEMVGADAAYMARQGGICTLAEMGRGMYIHYSSRFLG